MGERDPKYGQSWWAAANDPTTLPFKFNSLSDREFKPGDTINFESYEVKMSTKGNEYWQLKKVRHAGEAPTPSAAKQTDNYQDGMAWGNALNNATQLVINFGGTLELSDAVQAVLGAAHMLLDNRTESTEQNTPSVKPQTEQIPEYIPDAKDTDEVDLSTIPF
jgi:hypothetical protein